MIKDFWREEEFEDNDYMLGASVTRVLRAHDYDILKDQIVMKRIK